MDSLLQPPAATAFDAVSSLLSAAVYVLVALAALAQAPRDSRVRVFLIVALASAAPYCATALLWQRGATALLSSTVIVTVGTSLMAGSLALLHFTQVFPWRRPWIRRYGGWLWAGYAAVAILATVSVLMMPAFDTVVQGGAGFGAVSAEMAETTVLLVLAIGVPALFVLGIAAPFAALLSLYKSWQAAQARGIEGARTTLLWMLISQMGGGVLTILVIPLLRLIAGGPWLTAAAALLFACSLMMPIAFATGVWRYRVLELDIDALPQ